MRSISNKAYAKINLGLDVVGRRPDGYHEVDMIMQTVDIFDTVDIHIGSISELKEYFGEAAGKELCMEIQQDSYGERLLADDDNLCIKAAKAVLNSADHELKEDEGIRILLHKRIPIAAGMAGGSTDAAAVIRGLNELLDLSLSTDEMCRIGLSLGADIPYCIIGGCMRARGIGEELTAIRPAPDWNVLIAKPPIAVSTPEVYKAYDSSDSLYHPDIDALMQHIVSGDLTAACRCMENDLEEVTKGKYPIIAQIEDEMLKAGAIRSLMTGSGPTVYGIFEDEITCEKAAQTIKDKGLCPEVFATRMR